MSARSLMSVAAVAIVVAALAGAPGCAPQRPSDALGPAPPPVLDAPGVYPAEEGDVRAIGVLMRLAEGDDRWGVIGVSEGDAAMSQVVAVVVGLEALPVDPASFEGVYVEVRGVVDEGASAPGGPPVIDAVAIEALAESGP